jgi:hypothetical protein
MVFKMHRADLGRNFLIGLGDHFEASIRTFKFRGYTNGEILDVETCRKNKQ